MSSEKIRLKEMSSIPSLSINFPAAQTANAIQRNWNTRLNHAIIDISPAKNAIYIPNK